MCRVLTIFAGLWLAFFNVSAKAVTLDWDSTTWTAGTLSNSYDIDPVETGTDVTIAISGDTGRLRPHIAAPNPLTPALVPAFAGGLTPAQNTLALALDLSGNTQAVTLTLTFSSQYPVGIYDLSFTIFDVDYANGGGSTYQDQLRNIYGTTDGGTQIAPTITTSANNALSGSGLSQVVNGIASTPDTGVGSGNGNVTISFGSTPIRSFTFTYGSSSAFANPTYQHVGFFDFSYSPIPEVSPALTSGLSCMAAVGFLFSHVKVRRKR